MPAAAPCPRGRTCEHTRAIEATLALNRYAPTEDDFAVAVSSPRLRGPDDLMPDRGTSRGDMNRVSLQLHQLARALDERFVPHVHRAGVEGRNPEQDQTLLRTRGLAAMAAHVAASIPAREAGQRVTDYFCDDGIDAFAVKSVNPLSPVIYLVQAKWSAKGNHTFDVSETMKLVEGFAKLREERLHSDNLLHHHRGEIGQVMATPGTRVGLVFATSGYRHVPPNTRTAIAEAVARLTRNETPVDIEYLLLKNFVDHLEAGVARRGVAVSAPLLRNRPVDEQYPALQGTISAAELGQWYLVHDRAIFDDNVRVEMDSDVNDEIVDCLLHEPENFWFFNNGVTALCEHWQRAPMNGREVPYEFVDLRIVNGAQTVSSVGRAMLRNRESVAKAQVPIRFVALDREGPRFGARIAYATNRANPMRPRDFLAMDHVQQRLRDDFTLTWGRTYAIRANDRLPTGDAGCSVLEAVIAMACGRHDVATLVQAKNEITSLWHTQDERYRSLFHADTSVVEVWRRVQTMRVIMEALQQDHVISSERTKTVAALGDLLIAHVVFQQLGDDGINDIGTNWDDQLSFVAWHAVEALGSLVASVNQQLASGSASKNHWKSVAKLLRDKKWLDQAWLTPVHAGIMPEVRSEPNAPWPSEPEFRLVIKGEHRAWGRRCDGGFLVHSGSAAAVVDQPSLTTPQFRHRRNLRDSLNFVQDGTFIRLTRDALFESPSQAAAVLLGHSVNGADGWTTRDRKTYNEVTKAERDAADTGLNP